MCRAVPSNARNSLWWKREREKKKKKKKCPKGRREEEEKKRKKETNNNEREHRIESGSEEVRKYCTRVTCTVYVYPWVCVSIDYALGPDVANGGR